MNHNIDPEDVRLNFDPKAPQARFKEAGLPAAAMAPEALLPHQVSWPHGLAPTADPLNPAPAETDDLTRFAGYDAVVVTWTSAEASALAELFTPGYPIAQWYEYRHDINTYIPLVTGGKAPFNSTDREDVRYYHSLGLYMPCRIGNLKVLLFKSGLHLDYDGPAIPLRKLMLEIATAVQPKVFVTTGTGGGIGTEVLLGDVLVAGIAKFDCKTQFENEPWATASYNSSPLPANFSAALQSASNLLATNAARIPNARPQPKFFMAPTDTLLTTDFFGFDDSTDYYGLQGPNNRASDMGDAMVANAVQAVPNLRWYSIRNASDPQIANPNNDIKAASKEAANIYSRYGGLTTAASVIGTWALLTSA